MTFRKVKTMFWWKCHNETPFTPKEARKKIVTNY